MTVQVLICDDEPQSTKRMLDAINSNVVRVTFVSSPDEAIRELQSGASFDAVCVDLQFPVGEVGPMKNEGARIADLYKSKFPQAKIFGLTDYPSLLSELELSRFENVFSKRDLASSDGFYSLARATVAEGIAERAGQDVAFVDDLLKNKDFSIVTDLVGGPIVPSDPRTRRYTEVSYQINDMILRQAAANPDLIWKLDDRRFEEVCATIFCREGFHVHLTSKSADGGYDLLAFRDDGYLTALYLVECKRWHPQSKRVGVPILRQLNGVVEKMSAHGGVIMATTDFTLPAQEFSMHPSVRIDLVDFVKLQAWMRKVSSRIP